LVKIVFCYASAFFWPEVLWATLRDKVYKDHIQSVRGFSLGTDDASQLNSPVSPLEWIKALN